MLIERDVVTVEGEPWGVLLTEEELKALTAGQLRAAINGAGLLVVRRSIDGVAALDLINSQQYDKKDFDELFPACGTDHPDGSFEIAG